MSVSRNRWDAELNSDIEVESQADKVNIDKWREHEMPGKRRSTQTNLT